uniref:Leo1-like protein n=1 Tax=Steinernema glaseri TaxID=37863 RepID=A0A1I8AJK4_9BILA
MGSSYDQDVFSLQLGASDRKLELLLPPFIKVSPEPFDSETGAISTEEKEVDIDTNNVIHWKKIVDDAGIGRIVTNAKFVKWFDGTLSLVIGDKFFDMCKIKSHVDEALIHNTEDNNGSPFGVVSFFRHAFDEDTNEGDAPVNFVSRSKALSKVPPKCGPVQVLPCSEEKNPETQRRKDIKEAIAALRAQHRRHNVPKRRRHERQLSHNFLEGQDSDDGESVGAIKNQYRAGTYDSYSGRSSDESGSDADHRLDSAKLESDDGDSDVDMHIQKEPLKKRIVEDDEDEGEEGT